MKKPQQTPTPAVSINLAGKLCKSMSTTDNSPHVVVEARAGTGKTTTLVEGLKVLRRQADAWPNGPFIPSPQQTAIWNAIVQSDKNCSACFVAFNKAIATELQQRVPEGCDAMTMHSMGFRAVRRAFPIDFNSYRVQNIIAELLETNIRDLRRRKPEVLNATEKLVGLCKMNLVVDNVSDNNAPPDRLAEFAAYYDADLNGHGPEVFDLVPRVLERCKDVVRDGCIDFNDMIWLPIALELNVYRYDLLLIDEAQDLSRCQQALALKAGKRLILCGDPKQAIYNFAGADSKSMERMEKQLTEQCTACRGIGGYCNDGRAGMAGVITDVCATCDGKGFTGRGCIVLPLTVTRRCGRAIVKEAQKYVPDFEAHESCGEGFVANLRYRASGADLDCPRTKDGSHCYNSEYGKDSVATCLACGCPAEDNPQYHGFVQDGDMILCRVNAPLISEYFKFLKAGHKANVRGRDVGQGLIAMIRKLTKNSGGRTLVVTGKPGDPWEPKVFDEVVELLEKLSDWLHRETARENAKRNLSEARLIALQDRHDCLCCFCEGASTVEEVVQKIEAIFTDDKNGRGIMLSSIHKAKGLEAKRVFFIRTKDAPCPHPMARTPQAKEQEQNLCYVAITRAIEELVYVS